MRGGECQDGVSAAIASGRRQSDSLTDRRSTGPSDDLDVATWWQRISQCARAMPRARRDRATTPSRSSPPPAPPARRGRRVGRHAPLSQVRRASAFVEQGHQRYADTTEQWTPLIPSASPGDRHIDFAHVSPVSCLWAGDRPGVDLAGRALLMGCGGFRPGLRRAVQGTDASL